MTSIKYIGMDVHMESISICVRNSVGKIVMECVIETKASSILQFLDGLRGDLRVVFEEGTWATWLYDLMKPHVTEVLVCNTRKNAVRDGSKSDRIDARKLAEQLYMNNVKAVYHGECGLRMMKELARSYLTITKDLTRVMNRLKALYRSWGIPCAGKEVYAPRYRAEWLAKISEAGGPATRRVLLSTAGYLAAPAPGSPAGFIAGSEETQGVETAAPDSGDRSNPGSRPDCPDADAAPLPHQTTTVDLQRSGIRNA
jgi:transposase